jgi:hypothetical protein
LGLCKRAEWEAMMDAWEYFQKWAVFDCNSFDQNPNDLRLLGNTILSMHASVEYLALGQRGYDPEVSGTIVVEMCERYAMNLVWQTYRFAPIHSNMCER